MKTTPRRGLRDYESGDTNWDHSDTVQMVEEDSIDRGPIANRPMSGTYDDEFYYATDQDILWGWDDSSSDWVIRGGTGSKSQSLDAVHTKRGRVTGSDNITIRVPTDESTFHTALSKATEELAPRAGTNVIVLIESGHTVTEGVSLTGGNWEHIRIESEDTVVPVDVSGTFLGFFHCDAPQLYTLFDMEGNGGRGIELQNSRMHVEGDCGVRNAGERGIRVAGSRLRAAGSDWSGATDECMRFTVGSQAGIQSADCSNSGSSGRAVYVARSSIVSARVLDVSGSNGEGLHVRKSFVFADGIDASDCGGAGVYAHTGGRIHCDGATLTQNTGYGIYSRRSGHVTAREAVIDGGGKQVRVREGAFANVRGAELLNASNRPIQCSPGSTVNAAETTIDDFGDRIGVFTGSRAILCNTEITNSSYTTPIHVARGCWVAANQATVDGSPISDGDFTNNTLTVDSDGVTVF